MRVVFTTRAGDSDDESTLVSGHRLMEDDVSGIAENLGDILLGGVTSGIEFTLIEFVSWTTRFYVDATGTNTTDSLVVRAARKEIMGTVTSIWNAGYRVQGDERVFWVDDVWGCGAC